MEQHNTCHWKICIDIHDVWGMLLLLFLFLHRNVPLDNSSLWQTGKKCCMVTACLYATETPSIHAN